MQGQLREINCSSLLKLIAGEQHTGLLWIEAEPCAELQPVRDRTIPGQRAWVVSLVQGRLVYACQVGHGGERPEDCFRRLAIQPWPSDTRITNYSGELWAPEYGLLWLLLEQQFVTQGQVCAVARQLSEETLFELACLRQGRFQFVASAAIAPHFASFTTSVLTQRLERKLSHWQRLYPQIASLHQCPVLRNPDALAAHLPRPALGALHRWADGQTSILRLARHLNRHPVDVARALVPHLQAGHLQLRWATALPQPSPAEPQGQLASASPGEWPWWAAAPSPAALGRTPYLLWVGRDLARHRPELYPRLIQQLEQWGYGLSQCQQALPALEQAVQHRPLLIVCEVELSSNAAGNALSGYDFCRAGRQLAPLRHLPIILVQPEAPSQAQSSEGQPSHLSRRQWGSPAGPLSRTWGSSFWQDTQSRMVDATADLREPFQADELLMLLEKYIRPVPS